MLSYSQKLQESGEGLLRGLPQKTANQTCELVFFYQNKKTS